MSSFKDFLPSLERHTSYQHEAIRECLLTMAQAYAIAKQKSESETGVGSKGRRITWYEAEVVPGQAHRRVHMVKPAALATKCNTLCTSAQKFSRGGHMHLTFHSFLHEQSRRHIVFTCLAWRDPTENPCRRELPGRLLYRVCDLCPPCTPEDARQLVAHMNSTMSARGVEDTIHVIRQRAGEFCTERHWSYALAATREAVSIPKEHVTLRVGDNSPDARRRGADAPSSPRRALLGEGLPVTQRAGAESRPALGRPAPNACSSEQRGGGGTLEEGRGTCNVRRLVGRRRHRGGPRGGPWHGGCVGRRPRGGESGGGGPEQDAERSARVGGTGPAAPYTPNTLPTFTPPPFPSLASRAAPPPPRPRGHRYRGLRPLT